MTVPTIPADDAGNNPEPDDATQLRIRIPSDASDEQHGVHARLFVVEMRLAALRRDWLGANAHARHIADAPSIIARIEVEATELTRERDELTALIDRFEVRPAFDPDPPNVALRLHQIRVWRHRITYWLKSYKAKPGERDLRRYLRQYDTWLAEYQADLKAKEAGNVEATE